MNRSIPEAKKVHPVKAFFIGLITVRAGVYIKQTPKQTPAAQKG
nr:hypothetical protein [Acinetobacter sp. Marseille-Q1620]